MARAGDAPIATLSVAGTPFGRVTTVRGTAAVNGLFSFNVTALDTATKSRTADDLLGSAFELHLEPNAPSNLEVHGVVSSVRREAVPGHVAYELELRPAVFPLTLGSDHLVFQEKSVKDIVDAVLSAAGADPAEWHIEPRPARHYVAQYGESDWSFVERLLQDEGINYFFDLAKGETKLVLSDATDSAPEAERPLRFNSSRGIISDDDIVTDMTRSCRRTPTKVTLADYDFSKPKTKLSSSASHGDGDFEVYDFPGHFSEASAGTARAKRVLESFQATAEIVSGKSYSGAIRPGIRFEVKDHPVAALNETLFCIEATWEVDDGANRTGKAKGPGFSLNWAAIPAQVPFRPAHTLEDRRAGGPQTGIMCGPSGQDLHTDDQGRIRVQMHWDRKGAKDDKASTWMRVGQFPLGASMVRPRVGWALLVESHHGDVDEPFVSCHLYDGGHPVPYSLPANKTRTGFQTATTGGGAGANEVRFEDKKGNEEMFLNASKDMAVVVGDSKYKTVGADHTHKIGSNHAVTVGSNQQLQVTGDRKVTIGASETLTVSGDYQTGIGGSDTCSVGASRTVTALTGCSTDADGGRTLTVGATMMAVAATEVTRAVLGSCNFTIGAAWVTAAATGLGNSTAGASSETVGAVKLQAAAGSVSLGVKGDLAETVGAAYVSAAGGNAKETAGGALTFNVGGAWIANGTDIVIEAESEISITCGGASLKITSSAIELSAPSLASPGATIAKDGSAVHHNP